MMTMKTTPTNF